MKKNRWVEPIGLKATPRIGTPRFLGTHDDIPDWISFLIWAGWWMRSKAHPTYRLQLVALVPVRNCCAAIAALGACLASTQEDVGGLTFQEFAILPDKTRVSLRHRGRIFEGVLGACGQIGGQLFRRVTLDTSLRKWKESEFLILQNNLHEYQVSTDQRKNLSPQRQAALERVERFYRTLDPEMKLGWCLSARTEVLVVTSKAAWWRDIEDVSGQIDNESTSLVAPLADLVLATEEQQGFPGKTLLSSPSRIMDNASRVPVAILDGPDALRTAEEVDADAVLVLVEHSECDETAIHEIATIADARDDEKVPGGIPNRLPAGVEVSVFGWRKR